MTIAVFVIWTIILIPLTISIYDTIENKRIMKEAVKAASEIDIDDVLKSEDVKRYLDKHERTFAQDTYKQYQSFINEGFNEQQATQIICAIAPVALNNQRQWIIQPHVVDEEGIIPFIPSS